MYFWYLVYLLMDTKALITLEDCVWYCLYLECALTFIVGKWWIKQGTKENEES